MSNHLPCYRLMVFDHLMQSHLYKMKWIKMFIVLSVQHVIEDHFHALLVLRSTNLNFLSQEINYLSILEISSCSPNCWVLWALKRDLIQISYIS